LLLIFVLLVLFEVADVVSEEVEEPTTTGAVPVVVVAVVP
jgi:hypothetical protein